MAEESLSLYEVIANDLTRRVDQFRQSEQVWLGNIEWNLLRLQLENLEKSNLSGEKTRPIAEKISDLPQLLSRVPISDPKLIRGNLIKIAQGVIDNLSSREMSANPATVSTS